MRDRCWGLSQSLGLIMLCLLLFPLLVRTEMPTHIEEKDAWLRVDDIMSSPDFVPYSRPTMAVDQWIALGDSFSAGPGANGQKDTFGGSAYRGFWSYPMQMWLLGYRDWVKLHSKRDGGYDDQLGPAWTFSAYSGDKVKDLVEKQLVPGEFRMGLKIPGRPPFGSPQLAVMTIGGNDAHFGEIMLHCLYLNIFPAFCGNAQNVLRDDLDSGVLQNKIEYALYNTIMFGRLHGSANPPESFQLYIAEYVPYFDETTTNCDHYSWDLLAAFRVGKLKRELNQGLRRQLNELVVRVNEVIEKSAKRLEPLGVIFVGGVADKYIRDRHQFCAPGFDNNREMTSIFTWFWSRFAPTNTNSEGEVYGRAVSNGTHPHGSADPDDLSIVQQALDSAYGVGAMDPKTFYDSVVVPNTLASLAGRSPDLTHVEHGLKEFINKLLPLSIRRSLHPKGDGHHAYMESFMAAIKYHRNSTVPTLTDSSASTALQKPKTTVTVTRPRAVTHRAAREARGVAQTVDAPLTVAASTAAHPALDARSALDASTTTLTMMTETTTSVHVFTVTGTESVTTTFINPVPGEVGPANETQDGMDNVKCECTYRMLFNNFNILGKNWHPGINGELLHGAIKGCGWLTKWKFEWVDQNDPAYKPYSFYATGRLPIGTKACIGRAIVSTGGDGKGYCSGFG